MYHLGTHAGFIRGSYATHTALLKRYNYPVILFVFRVDFLQHPSSSSRAPLTIVPNWCKKHIRNGKNSLFAFLIEQKCTKSAFFIEQNLLKFACWIEQKEIINDRLTAVKGA